VISEGSSCVNTVTSISPNPIGAATSPPSPCANALSTKNGIDIIAIRDNNKILWYNTKITLIPLLNDSIKHNHRIIIVFIINDIPLEL
jgi:hypothetical protein